MHCRSPIQLQWNFFKQNYRLIRLFRLYYSVCLVWILFNLPVWRLLNYLRAWLLSFYNRNRIESFNYYNVSRAFRPFSTKFEQLRPELLWTGWGFSGWIMTEKYSAQTWLVRQGAEQWDWVGGTAEKRRQCFIVWQGGKQEDKCDYIHRCWSLTFKSTHGVS